MKKHLYILALVAIGFSACGPTYVVQQPAPPPPAAPLPPPPQGEPEDVTYQNFYDQLSPYGQWIEDPNYGYVWLPDAGPDFKPYATNGHWVYTDEGWAWDSGYPWGWAAFHYGRWFFQDGYGWVWVPGNEWAPAWVAWRNSDQYYGWAPMGPGIGYDYAYGGSYMPPAYCWNFVPHQYIGSPQVHNYYVRETNNVTIINQTTIIRNTTVINNNGPRNARYGYGPSPTDVGRYGGTTVRPVSIRDSRTPGQRYDNNSYTVYRPRVNGGNDPRANTAVRPARVETINNARPVNRTVYGNNGNNNGSNGNNGWQNGNGRNNDGRNNNGNNGNNNGWQNQNDRNNDRNNWNNNNRPGQSNGRPGQNDGRTNTGFPNNPPANQPTQPVRQQPVQNPPVQNPPVQNQPSQPVQNPPTQSIPSQPAQNQPVRPTRPAWPPAQSQPVNNQPVNNQPAANPQPVQNQPVQRPGSQFPVTRGGIERPGNTPNTQTPRTQPPASNPNPQRPEPRPAAAQPKPAPAPANTPPPARSDDTRRPGRS